MIAMVFALSFFSKIYKSTNGDALNRPASSQERQRRLLDYASTYSMYVWNIMTNQRKLPVLRNNYFKLSLQRQL
jgi:hypothetical protein